MTVVIPSGEDLILRSRELAPVVTARVAWQEENRRLHDETIEALHDAGIFRMRVPLRFGGYESEARTMLAVADELGRSDGSASWTASAHWIATWIACLFPDEVQEEVFSTPDVRVCGALSPLGVAVNAPGGLIVNGDWGYISGALHSHWQVIAATASGPDGQPMPIIALVPMSVLAIADDWHTTGLRGTGSVSTRAHGVFVPAERVLSLTTVLNNAPNRSTRSPIYRPPLLPVAAASSVGTVIGLAQAAQDAFLRRLPGAEIPYTTYSLQSEAPLTHLQIAEAAMKVDEARNHAQTLASRVDVMALESGPWTLRERARARAEMGAACRLAKEAVDVLATASGSSSIYRDVSIQRIQRDIQAVNLHGLMHPNTNTELYGRVLCGLEPNTFYI